MASTATALRHPLRVWFYWCGNLLHRRSNFVLGWCTGIPQGTGMASPCSLWFTKAFRIVGEFLYKVGYDAPKGWLPIFLWDIVGIGI